MSRSLFLIEAFFWTHDNGGVSSKYQSSNKMKVKNIKKKEILLNENDTKKNVKWQPASIKTIELNSKKKRKIYYTVPRFWVVRSSVTRQIGRWINWRVITPLKSMI